MISRNRNDLSSMQPKQFHLLSPVCVVLLLTCVRLDGATDTNWPQFRGPNASGVSAGAVPTTWNVASAENLRWQTPLPGLGHASPIVWENRIYIATTVRPGAKAELKSRAAARATGQRGERISPAS